MLGTLGVELLDCPLDVAPPRLVANERSQGGPLDVALVHGVQSTTLPYSREHQAEDRRYVRS